MSYFDKLLKNKANLLKNVPPITYNRIRRIREPFFIALIKEQLEENFVHTAKFLAELHEKLPHDERTAHSPPQKLTNLQQLFEDLSSVLRQLEENCHFMALQADKVRENNLLKIYSDIFIVADALFDYGTEYYAIIEEILLLTMRVMQKFCSDNNVELTVNVCYQLGHFYHHTNENEKACAYLDKATVYLPRCTGTLLGKTESLSLTECIYFDFVASLLAAASAESDFSRAKHLTVRSIAVAMQFGNQNAIGESNYFFGVLLSRMQRMSEACEKFHCSIAAFRGSQNTLRLCAAQLKLVNSLIGLKQNHECIECLVDCEAIAKMHNHQNELAQAYELHGRVNEQNNRPLAAVEYYNRAMVIYTILGMRQRATECRCAGAKCLAAELMESLANLRIKMNEEILGNNLLMQKLIKWKDNREWDDGDDGGAGCWAAVHGQNFRLFK